MRNKDFLISKSIIFIEVVLLLRKTGFWLYSACLVVLAIYVVSIQPRSASAFDILVSLISNLTALAIIPMTWFIMEAILRHKSTSRDWFWITQGDTPTVVLGQFVGLFIGFMISLILAFGTASLFMIFQRRLDSANVMTFWGYALAIVVPLAFFVFSMVFVVGAMLNRMMATLLVVIVFHALIILGILMPYVTLFTPLNHTLMNFRIDPLVGIGAEKSLITSLLWLYVSIAISLTIVAMWLSSRREIRRGFHHRNRWWTGFILVGGIVSMVGATYAYQMAIHHSIVPPPVVDQVEVWEVVDATHDATLEQSHLAVQAQLQLMNTSDSTVDSIVLALNPGFQIVQATIDNQVVDAQYEGEVIRLTWQDSSTIIPDQIVSVTVSYQGKPRLLREDYSFANSIGVEEPTMFRRPIYTYVESTTAMLHRDGDWRIWPHTSTPHVAEYTDLAITVPQKHTIVSSGQATQQNEESITYIWTNSIPQFLISTAPYRLTEHDFGTIYTAQMGNDLDVERTTVLLQMRHTLAEILGEPLSEENYQAVVLPYTQDIITSNSIIGVPLTTKWLSDSQEQWFDEPHLVQRNLALALTKSSLSDRIAWTRTSLHVDGQPRSITIECTYDASGNETCNRQIRGANTPHAPQGRLVEPDVLSPLLHAWGVVLSRSMIQDQFNSTTFDDERRLWKILSESPELADRGAYNEAQSVLNRQGLLPNISPDRHQEAQKIAHFVIQIDQLYQRQGNVGLRDAIDEMIIQYPVGSSPLTEEQFEQIMSSTFIELGSLHGDSRPKS
ncbi:MAG: hypothetical protein GFH27_549413n5 [Chloroflexi bacterium AL-W]|nr:hypothetical protein [Chloroflexi bacterium AL-N1]NOK71403.1 hypothetical protein [Chloroflexi bacterium AL-N10]NOK78806.1 hypothetical protein [Chloroflexi bacterium AL-N5]NOK86224.1 hypothetical protein [Chloroflexi bacterium AL-W]NOK93128.1 hypothetical protein [Chloroflexi bacterium AL-N15]